MERPLEIAEKKYNYEVFMRRIVGQELYYHLDKEKTLLENLKGKILLEFPEFIVTTPEKAQVWSSSSSFRDSNSFLVFQRPGNCPPRLR